MDQHEVNDVRLALAVIKEQNHELMREVAMVKSQNEVLLEREDNVLLILQGPLGKPEDGLIGQHRNMYESWPQTCDDLEKTMNSVMILMAAKAEHDKNREEANKNRKRFYWLMITSVIALGFDFLKRVWDWWTHLK